MAHVLKAMSTACRIQSSGAVPQGMVLHLTVWDPRLQYVVAPLYIPIPHIFHQSAIMQPNKQRPTWRNERSFYSAISGSSSGWLLGGRGTVQVAI